MRYIIAILTALACACQAAPSYLMNPQLFGSTILGDVTAGPAAVVAAYTNADGGTYTNTGTTNTWKYRIAGTNSLGRTAYVTQSITFAESSSGAVRVAWSRADPVGGYVLAKSFDAGASWSNTINLGASVTQVIDYALSTWTSGSNSVSAMSGGTSFASGGI